MPISKQHSILAVANLLAHNNISQIGYCSQISLQSAAVNCSFSDNLTPSEVTFILLAMVPAKTTEKAIILTMQMVPTVAVGVPRVGGYPGGGQALAGVV